MWVDSLACLSYSLLLLSFEFLLVELELSAFEDVSIKTAALSGAGRDAGQKLVGVEQVGELLFQFASLLAALESGLDVLAAFGFSAGGVGLLDFLLVELNIVVLEIPLSEGGGIDQDNGVLNESLRSDELVVGSVVDAIENTGLARHGLGTP